VLGEQSCPPVRAILFTRPIVTYEYRMPSTVPLIDWVSLAACTGHLTLAVLVLLKGRGSSLRFPLALIGLTLFVWGFAQWAYRMSAEPLWDWLETTTSPLHPPLMFLFAVRYVGRSRELKPATAAIFCIWLAMVLVSAIRVVAPEVDAWVERETWWPAAFLAGLIPTVVATLALFVEHLRKVSALEEQVTTRLLIAAVLVGNLLGATELRANSWTEESTFIPGAGLGNVGALAATVLLTLVVLRYRLLVTRPSELLPLYSLTVGLLGVLGYLAVASFLRTDVALLVLGTSTVTFALAVAAGDLFTTIAAARNRTRHLATLGRFSAQLDHDLRSPLSTLKISLEILLDAQDGGCSTQEHREFVEVSMDQVKQIERLLSKYQRLGAVKPECRSIDLNDLVSSVWRSVLSARTTDAVHSSLELGHDLPLAPADADLLAAALQNLILNALDASTPGGRVTLETALEPGGQLAIVVSDEGIGMDSRQLERAFDDFYTTKADGTGLGLGFVQRVVVAHGGRVTLDSQLGAGTTVRLTLPAKAEAN
jgi:signal transduction histidine kinase